MCSFFKLVVVVSRQLNPVRVGTSRNLGSPKVGKRNKV